MKKLEPTIKNVSGEKLDTWVEIPDGSIKATVIIVHGFGTDKHETAGYFDDISKSLVDDNFRVIRFDFSGYGQSDGRQEDACYSKHIGDLNAVIEYAKSNFADPLYLFAQSMGCFITALASPTGIAKTLMTGIPNSNTQYIIDLFVKRFGSRVGAKLDFNRISELPRSTGKIQKLGKKFWQDIRNLSPLDTVRDYSLKTELLIIHWHQDEIIGKQYVDEYDKIPTLTARWLSGNHSVTNPVDRKNFIQVMLKFFNH